MEKMTKLNKTTIGLFISIGASLLSVIGFILVTKGISDSVGGTLLLIGFGAGIVSYILGGGILYALSLMWKVVKGCFNIFYFPLACILAIIAVVYGGIAIVCLPVIPMLKMWLAKKDEEAETLEVVDTIDTDNKDVL